MAKEFLNDLVNWKDNDWLNARGWTWKSFSLDELVLLLFMIIKHNKKITRDDLSRVLFFRGYSLLNTQLVLLHIHHHCHHCFPW